jgi:ABC-2 type transport system permease protein
MNAAINKGTIQTQTSARAPIFSGAILRETLRRQWRGMLIWGGMIALLAWMQVAILSDVSAIEQMAELMTSLPPFILAMVGGGDAQFLATPEGYLAMRYFGFIILIYGIYAVTLGLNVTANDEERGIADVHLSLPITRANIVLGRAAAASVLLLGAIGMGLAGLLLGLATTSTIQVDMGKMVIGTLNMIPTALVMLTFTVLAGALLRRRSAATSVTAAFIVGSYFLDTLGRSAPGSVLDSARAISFYSYYDGTGVIQNGLALGNVILLLGVTAVLLIGGIVAYQRRDIGL